MAAVTNEDPMHTLTIEVDDADLDAIRNATAQRQALQCMPDDTETNLGSLLAEVCRGYMELRDQEMRRHQ